MSVADRLLSQYTSNPSPRIFTAPIYAIGVFTTPETILAAPPAGSRIIVLSMDLSVLGITWVTFYHTAVGAGNMLWGSMNMNVGGVFNLGPAVLPEATPLILEKTATVGVDGAIVYAIA